MRTDWQRLCMELLSFNFYSIPFNRLLLGHRLLACMQDSSLPWHTWRCECSCLGIHNLLCFLSYPLLPYNKAFGVFAFGAWYVPPSGSRRWNYHVRFFSRLALGAVMAHARGLVVVLVLTAVGVFGIGRVYQGDLSPESIPEHCHFHCHRPPCLTPSPCTAAVAQQAAGPALQCEALLKLRGRSGDTI